MKILYALIIPLFYSLSVFSQEDTTQDWMKVLRYGAGNQTGETEITPEQAEQRSTQCLPEQFTNANLTLSNGSYIENVWVKFDYKEKVLLIMQDKSVIVGAPNIIDRVDFLDSEFDPLLNVSQPGRAFGRQGFYSVLLQQDQNYLLKYITLEEKKPTGNTMLETAELYDVPDEEPEYFKAEELLISKNRKLYLLDNFKSKSLSQFDELQGALKSFVKQEKLKTKNDEDLKKFAMYFWSL